MLGTAYLSLIATPIWDGLIPFLAIVTMSYEILFGVCATHRAHLLLNGVTVELIPFPFPFDCIRPIDYHNIKIIFIIFNYLFANHCNYTKIMHYFVKNRIHFTK
jgi:hypothetical protein